MKTYRLYVKAENCTSKGTIYGADHLCDYADDCDCFLWGEGTREELIEQALRRLALRNDKRAGGAGDGFDWKCAQNVLDYLNGPEVEFDQKTMAYLIGMLWIKFTELGSLKTCLRGCLSIGT